MNNLKVNNIGIDVPIKGFQTYLYDNLKALWKLDDTNLEGYGRCYRNVNDKGIVPELFVSGAPGTNNTVYKAAVGENGFDKTRTWAQFFFDVDPVTQFKAGQENAKLSIVFIVNLEKIKPLLPSRGDEETRVDIETLCSKRLLGLDLTGTETGYKNVFKFFTGLMNQDTQVFEDRHPLLCIKINMEIFYKPTLIEC